jgi:hypothetical protein
MGNPNSWFDYLIGGHKVPYRENMPWDEYLRATAYNAIPAIGQTVANIGAQTTATNPLAQYYLEHHSNPDIRRMAIQQKKDVEAQVLGLPGAITHVVTHPGESFEQDPVGTVQLFRGITGLARHGLGAVERGATRTGETMYPASAGAKTARVIAATTGAGRKIASGAETVMDAPMAIARRVAGRPIPAPRSIFAPTDANPFALSPQAEEALSRSGLSLDEQQRVRTTPTLLREWEKTSQYGKSGRPIGVSPESLRQAILSHSGVDPANISFSAATGKRPVNMETAQAMNEAARSELTPPPGSQTSPPPVAITPPPIGGYYFKDGVWATKQGIPANPATSKFLTETSIKETGIDPRGGAAQPDRAGGTMLSNQDTSDLAHGLLDESDAAVAAAGERPKQTWLGRTARGILDTGTALATGYIGHTISPGVGMLAGPAFGYAVDRFVAPMTGAAGNPAIERFGAPPVKPDPSYSTPLLAGTYAAQGKRETEQPAHNEDWDVVAPPPSMVVPPAAAQPSNQNKDVAAPLAHGGRTAYRKGGRVATHIEPLVQDLMSRYKHAKKAETATTKPLLQHHDKAIVKALNIAKKAI